MNSYTKNKKLIVINILIPQGILKVNVYNYEYDLKPKWNNVIGILNLIIYYAKELQRF